MLYFIESGSYAKIGYTEDYKTLKTRLITYRTHNPNFRIVDTTEGTKEDENRLQQLYNDYRINATSEWCFAKKLVAKIWTEYRASKENVDYYTEFGLNPEFIGESEKIGIKEYANAVKNNLITTNDIDLYKEFKDYYEAE